MILNLTGLKKLYQFLKKTEPKKGGGEQRCRRERETGKGDQTDENTSESHKKRETTKKKSKYTT